MYAKTAKERRQLVSTHSRPKAAGKKAPSAQNRRGVSTHSRPKAAGLCQPFHSYAPWGFNTQPPEDGWREQMRDLEWTGVSTHSRPKAAGKAALPHESKRKCFNTQPPEGGWYGQRIQQVLLRLFQHTAARRRLARRPAVRPCRAGFNTQPPEGGWVETSRIYMNYSKVSTHSRPKAAGGMFELGRALIVLFQHTAARRRLAAQIK